MKGLDPLIGMVLIIAISIATIAIVLEVGIPATDRAKEIMIFDEMKSNMITLDSKIIDVSLQGEGSSYRINMIVNGGRYNITSNTISSSMESSSQIVGIGVSYTEDGMDVTGSDGQVSMSKTYDNVNIVGGGSFGRGNYNINIKNEGYDDSIGMQIINITIS